MGLPRFTSQTMMLLSVDALATTFGSWRLKHTDVTKSSWPPTRLFNTDLALAKRNERASE